MLEAKQLADQQGRTFTALVQEALRDYVAKYRSVPKRIPFIGIGDSEAPMSIEEQNEMLAEGLGWDSLSEDQLAYYRSLGL
jgi:hypothetical protein